MKLAIIGSGIAGSSLAYFLKDSKIDITVYESREIVGGRMRHVDFRGGPVEIGAGFFHTANRNIMQLTDELDIEKVELSSDTFGLWNGENMRYQTNESNFATTIKLLMRFGFNLMKMQSIVKLVKSNIKQFYENDEIFHSVPEMISMMSFDKIYQESFDSNLSNFGVKEKIKAELALPATKYIYHQCGNRGMNGFAGYVSLIASDDEPIYYIKNGNSTLCEALLKEAKVTLSLKDGVKSIKKEGERYSITSENGTILYDKVVIATPMEIAKIELINIDKKINADRDYVAYCKTIVAGKIDPSFFKTNKIPEMILVTEKEDIPMFGMTRLRKDKSEDIWVISAHEAITDDLLEEIFIEINEVQKHTVPYTYPSLEPVSFDKFEDIKIDNGFYYSSGVDTLSPTMESSIIISKNISRLLNGE